VKMLGNGRLEALCFDGSKRLANVSDTKKKKNCPSPEMTRVQTSPSAQNMSPANKIPHL
jgi:hypothetical protein